ncbi:MAG: HlyD family efflux transporter periplasmic adaptor subunit, partial [Muribaculaceae bacterium]|nr:HlyD family efflux transporter periplasmic adaptor subunit [Muribaculaceae bacterium]
TLTYVNNNIGQQISMGEHIATIADLSHFSVNGDIADSYADRVVVGNRATVKIGKTTIDGTINTVSPMSKSGVMAFTVKLDDDQNPSLRPGVRTEVYVKGNILDDVVRIPNGSYYTGPAVYDMFVVEGDELVKRKVTLGGSNWEYVEVVSGLQPGEEVVTSDMKDYANNKTLKLK